MSADRWPVGGPNRSWPDERLVQECIRGREEAWSALIDKYQNLIFSIPIKLGLSREDAADIFQQVCLGLLRELPRLRDPKSLAAWLIRVTSHSTYEWSRKERRYAPDSSSVQQWSEISSPEMSDKFVREVEEERILREAFMEVPPRCRKLIEMLFFQNPPLSYQEAAERLGVALGSVGFIRMRCLRKLRQLLQSKGF